MYEPKDVVEGLCYSAFWMNQKMSPSAANTNTNLIKQPAQRNKAAERRINDRNKMKINAPEEAVKGALHVGQSLPKM